MPVRFTAVLALVAVLVFAACGDATVEPSSTTTTTPEVSTTSTTAPEVSTTIVPSTTEPAPDGDAGDLPDDVVALAEVVEEIRGLPFLSRPTVTVLSREELGERMRTEIEESLDPTEIAVEQGVYELLGMLDGTVDLGTALADLYAEQIGGRYLPETHEMVVIGDADLSPLTKFILFHELVHALGDQHFGFGDRLTELVEAERYEEATALQALVEGDATYFQIVYLQQLPADEQVAVASEMLGLDTSTAEGLPGWLTDDLAFPYDYGFGFVSRIVADEGIAGVDQAYRLPPETAEQIMHPEKYFAFEPARQVPAPDAAPPGYEMQLGGTFGEWSLRLFLTEALGAGDAVIASAGWGGDAFQMLSSGSEVAFTYRYSGDTPRDADELETALVEAAGRMMAVGDPVADDAAGTTTFTGDDFAFVQRAGTTVVFVAASDPAAGGSLAETLRIPASTG